MSFQTLSKKTTAIDKTRTYIVSLKIIENELTVLPILKLPLHI